MNTSPLDLRHQRFRIASRGSDRIETAALRAAATGDYEQALDETDRIGLEVRRIEAMLIEHREHEQSLRHTLTAARNLRAEVKDHSTDAARPIVRKPEAHVEIVTERTQRRIDDLHREIDALTLQRREVATSIEATIQRLRHTLDYVWEGARRDETMMLRRRRDGAGPASGDDPRLAVIR